MADGLDPLSLAPVCPTWEAELGGRSLEELGSRRRLGVGLHEPPQILLPCSECELEQREQTTTPSTRGVGPLVWRRTATMMGREMEANRPLGQRGE
jgi:hypothetical protein